MALDRNMRTEARRRLSEWFAAERGEALNTLGADLLLDFLDEELSWIWYNQGIRDARGQFEKDFANLGERLDLLEKMPPLQRRHVPTSNR
jgi:uncharacterized protein (DUF2164 family)